VYASNSKESASKSNSNRLVVGSTDIHWVGWTLWIRYFNFKILYGVQNLNYHSAILMIQLCYRLQYFPPCCITSRS
jgi:hypothetical protein